MMPLKYADVDDDSFDKCIVTMVFRTILRSYHITSPSLDATCNYAIYAGLELLPITLPPYVSCMLSPLQKDTNRRVNRKLEDDFDSASFDNYLKVYLKMSQ